MAFLSNAEPSRYLAAEPRFRHVKDFDIRRGWTNWNWMKEPLFTQPDQTKKTRSNIPPR